MASYAVDKLETVTKRHVLVQDGQLHDQRGAAGQARACWVRVIVLLGRKASLCLLQEVDLPDGHSRWQCGGGSGVWKTAIVYKKVKQHYSSVCVTITDARER